MQSDTQEANDIVTLANLQYNGSTPADAFETKVTNIINRLNNNGIHINNKVACQLIMRGLSGEYKFLRYTRHRHLNMTVAELFLDIHAIYEEQQGSRNSKPNYRRNLSDEKNDSRSYTNTTKPKVIARNPQKQIIRNRKQPGLTMYPHLITLPARTTIPSVNQLLNRFN
ncbi:hypothetical protein SCEN_G00490 [Saccharomyces cerevisiae]|nr:hypothetical protein SCEN_G00490 [Saccharomyces cerevisiae]